MSQSWQDTTVIEVLHAMMEEFDPIFLWKYINVFMYEYMHDFRNIFHGEFNQKILILWMLDNFVQSRTMIRKFDFNLKQM